ncbi:MAG: UvrD-helicase domain-containing protein [Bacteroidetes bacterium]|nr:UvrD-helicase domain-containing protein [Bacteroidota bacterium]
MGRHRYRSPLLSVKDMPDRPGTAGAGVGNGSTDERATAVHEDMQAREDALDVTRSFIVQAPAGSGKTELLIQRYLALLATVEAPEEIIAITFTRKAASEMRMRIFDALRTADEPDAQEQHDRKTQHLARQVLQKDAQHGWSLKEQPGRMRLLTIDALNGWIARQMPWLSGIGPLPHVTDDAGAFYSEAVRAVLLDGTGDDDLRPAVRELLIHLDNRFETVEGLLVSMLAIRDQWIDIVHGGLDDASTRILLEQGFSRTITGHLERCRASMREEDVNELSALAAHAAAVLESDPARKVDQLGGCLGRSQPPGTEVEDLTQWMGLTHLLLTGADGFRSPRGINISLGFGPKDPVKARLIDVLEKVSGDEQLRELLAKVRKLPSPRFADAQWNVISSMVLVLKAALLRLHTLFSRRAAADHIEVAIAARRALGEELAPTDLSMMLEYRIRHILVDEFQDTSASQFLLLRRLTAGWSAPDLHTLFLVGDPMQSIYRFREAEVGLFLQLWEERRLGDVPLTPVMLRRNFRSHEGVVSWVNRTFASIMPASNDVAFGAVAYAPSVAVHPAEETAVEYRMVYSGDREEEARMIADVLKGEPCGEDASIAVLVRSRTHLAELVPVLRRENIPFRAVEIEALGRHSAVRDLLALTRALLYPADRIAWLSLLRAPYCGLTLADLHALCGDDKSTPLRTLLADPARRASLSDDGRQRLERVLPILSEGSACVRRGSLRDVVASCWTRLGGHVLLDAEGLDAAMAFLQLLVTHSEGGDLDDPLLLEQEAAALFAPPDPNADPRIQIMTIHKAKGLQFDIVVLPRLDGRPRHEEERLLLWERAVVDDRLVFLIAPMGQRGGDRDAIYDYIRLLRSEKSSHESLRLFYVAATRARRRLYCCATLHEREKDGERTLVEPQKGSLLSLFWPECGEAVREDYEQWRQGVVRNSTAAPGREASPAASGDRQATTYGCVPAQWSPSVLEREELPVRAPEQGMRMPVDDGDIPWRAGRSARAVGIVVHALLQRIAHEGIAYWQAQGSTQRMFLLRTLFRQSGMADPDTAMFDRAAQAVDRMLADERGRMLLTPQTEAECELALTGVDGTAVVSVKIDRSYVDAEGTRWIVDYKTSMHEGAGLESFLRMQEEQYLPQLQRYARLIREWDGRPVRAALYFPLLGIWRELALDPEGN